MYFTVAAYRHAAEAEIALNASLRDPTDDEVEVADALYQKACTHVPIGAREMSEKANLVLLVEGNTLEPAVMAALVSIRDGAARPAN